MKDLPSTTDFRITDGRGFKLTAYPTRLREDTDKDKLEKSVKDDAERIGELQEKLYAHDRYAVLMIFQAMDAAGKDGAIKHVMSGINP